MKIITHQIESDKFIIPYLEFLSEKFDLTGHRFLIRDHRDVYFREGDERGSTSVFGTRKSKLLWFLKLVVSWHRAEKIILHGLFKVDIVLFLLFQPWLISKCYWVMWGGDLYWRKYNKNGIKNWVVEKIRRMVIKRIQHVITYLPGDVDYLSSTYGSKPTLHHCLLYTSNIFEELDIEPTKKTKDSVTIQVGNSSDPSNNHQEILEKLKKIDSDFIKVFVPLAYGDKINGDLVEKQYRDFFGKRFNTIRNLVPLEEYNKILSDIDIAIFAHERQQAMGNIITLLGLGKTVYLNPKVSHWTLFSELGIKVYPTDKPTLLLQGEKVSIENMKKIKSFFSRKKLCEDWENIFLHCRK